MSTDLLAAATEQFPQTVPGPASGDPRTSATVRNMGSPLANGALWLRRRLEEVVGSFLPLGGLFPVAASVATSTFTIAGHGLSANDPVRVQSIGGAVPSPLVAGTTYYAVNVATNTFKVSATSGGSAINLTDLGSGNIYVAKTVGSPIISAQTTDLLTTVAAYSGASFTIAAGTLQTYLRLLADKAAKLDAGTNAFTNNMTVGGTLGVTGTLTANGDMNVAGNQTVVGNQVLTGTLTANGVSTFNGEIVATSDATFEGATLLSTGSVFSRSQSTISASATTVTIAVTTAPFFLADSWNGAGGALAVTVSDYAGSGAPEFDIWFNPTSQASTMAIKRASTATMITITGSGTVKLRWDFSNTKWRAVGASILDTSTGAIAHGVL